MAKKVTAQAAEVVTDVTAEVVTSTESVETPEVVTSTSEENNSITIGNDVIDTQTGEVVQQTTIDDRIEAAVAEAPKWVNVKGYLFQREATVNENTNYQYYNVVVNGEVIGRARQPKYKKDGVTLNPFSPLYLSINGMEEQSTFATDFPFQKGKTSKQKANDWLQSIAFNKFKDPEFVITPVNEEAVQYD